MSAPPIIEARGLARTFELRRRGGWFGERAALRAVDRVSFRVAPGETVALVGESGSGKSTLGRLVLRLLEPTAGALFWRGRDIAALDAAERRAFRREVQVVFQDTGSSFNPRASVLSAVMLPLRYNRGLDRTAARLEAEALLDQVGLAPDLFARRLPHELSGGQRQRVGIARALASEPALVVADEAVSALDVSVRAQVLQLMRALKQGRGLAYLFITHDLGVVAAVADRVLVMYLGAIVEAGPVESVFAQPLHPYTRALLRAMPQPDPARRRERRLEGLEGELPNAAKLPGGCRFHPRCPFAVERCRVEAPENRSFDGGREAACHFAGAFDR